ncbi:MAG: bifunctional 5,10-methylenetetrahydrofolate dehydrogenase/5,10-methenyltetrahydrofolate cyclohydrolase [Oscillospiraceae bacterium]|nr:bifunctional 5,10-methylenetetrahydrofolate dehydrogenase/5,10-methenyltetrahydrofolate cyclohydrolase [Oscillospiraceae bacterium]
MAEILKGAPVAEKLLEELTPRCKALISCGIHPTLAVLKVGDDPSAASYLKGAAKRCAQVGIEVWASNIPENAPQDEIIMQLYQLGQDGGINGVLALQPFPEGIDSDEVLSYIPAERDVDGVSPGSLAGVFSGKKLGFAPCTARACMEILKYYNIPIEGKRVAVLGRSLVIGRPVAMMLMEQNATVTICHSKTKNAAEICRNSDIVIAAVGKAKAITAEYFSPGQVVIDVGIHATDDGLCGDVDFEAAEKIVSAITPVPGGVGSVTTAILATHTIEAAERATSAFAAGRR